MDVIVDRCAGLDVHKKTVMATIRTPGGAGGRAENGDFLGQEQVEPLDEHHPGARRRHSTTVHQWLARDIRQVAEHALRRIGW